jgi:threonine/homoserine/homoserine lactone efflux protein
VLALLGSIAVISLSGVMMPGPVFAVTAAKSQRSPWAGSQIAIGHAIIEIPLILLIYFGLGHIFQNDVFQIVLAIVGGAIIIWLGWGMFRARRDVAAGSKDLPYNAVTAGIITSAVNPYFLLWWATVGLMLLGKFSAYGFIGLVAFTVVHWSCDFIWYTFVSIVLNRGQKVWGVWVQEVVFILCAISLAGFGIYFMVSGIAPDWAEATLSITATVLSLFWLLRETDWLRLRLPAKSSS